MAPPGDTAFAGRSSGFRAPQESFFSAIDHRAVCLVPRATLYLPSFFMHGLPILEFGATPLTSIRFAFASLQSQVSVSYPGSSIEDRFFFSNLESLLSAIFPGNNFAAIAFLF
jgi:hypothetical protein